MGGSLTCMLPSGWETQLKEIKVQNTQFARQTLGWLKDLAIRFVQSISADGDVSSSELADKALASQLLSCIFSPFTRGEFLVLCKDVVKWLIKRSSLFPASVQQFLMQTVKLTLDGISWYAKNPQIKDYFDQVVAIAQEEIVAEAARKVGREQATKATVGTVADLIENTTCLTRYARASKQGIQALKTGAVVDGVLLLGTVGYSYYKYKKGHITKKRLQRTIVKRTGGAAGSIGGSATGAFVGTLLFPGVGTFIGGLVGGIAGDHLGSKAADYAIPIDD